MKIYIARGQNVWTASLDRDDAVLRWVAQTRNLKGLSLVSTTGDDWSISMFTGALTSDTEIVEEHLDATDLVEMASRAASNARRMAHALRPRGLGSIKHQLSLAEDNLDDLVCSSPEWITKKVC